MFKIIEKMIERINNYQSRTSIAKRVFILCVILVIIPVFILVFAANSLSESFLARKSIHTSIQNLDLITQSVNGLMNHVEDISKIIVSNDRVQEQLRETGPSQIQTQRSFENQFIIRSMLDNVVGQGVSIESIVIYSVNGGYIHSGSTTIETSEVRTLLTSDLLLTVKDKWGVPVWTDTHFFTHQNQTENENGIAMYRAIIDINDGKMIGVLEINVAKDTLYNLYNHLEYGKQGGFMIMNKNGTVISESIHAYDYAHITPQNFYSEVTSFDKMGKLIKVDRTELLITTSFFNRLDWYMIGFLPANELKEDNAFIQTVLFIIGILCIAYGIVTAKLISKLIAKPVVDLAKSMDRVGRGNLDTRVTVKSSDEVGVLSKSFNSMTMQISELMQQMYHDQEKMRALELVALHEQIKPHFLYNSLESIAALSKLERTDDVFNMVKALAMFYRTSLSVGRNIITLKEEMEITKYYLEIQQFRYQNKFDYHFQVDGAALTYQIPKLVVQPLVENAIYHGIKNKRIKGRLIIVIKKTDKQIVISVADNGLGMNEDQIKAVENRLNDFDNSTSYGLKNINERIKKFYGTQYGIHIASKYGFWTRADITIPARQINEKKGEE